MKNHEANIPNTFLIYFILFITFTLSYEYFQIGLKPIAISSIFFFVKNITIWGIIALSSLDNKIKKTKNILFFLIFVLIISLPEIWNLPHIKHDKENLIIKSFLYFLALSTLKQLIFKDNKSLWFIVIIASLVPLLNFEYANNYIHNFFLLWPLTIFKLIPIQISNTLILNIGSALINTSFCISIIYGIKISINPLFKSKRKSDFLIYLISLKSLIYWSVATVGLTIIGNNNLGFFTNKVGLFLTSLGFVFLVIFSIYFVLQLIFDYYPKISPKHFLLMLPIIDWILAIFIDKLDLKIQWKGLKITIILLLASFVLFQYFTLILALPESYPDLKTGLIILNLIIPFIYLVSFIFSNKNTLTATVIFSIVLIPFLSIYVVPRLVNIDSIVQLSLFINLALHFGLLCITFKLFKIKLKQNSKVGV